MKVGICHPIMFRSSPNVTKPDSVTIERPQIKELGHVTPDFAVKTPLKYNKIGIEELGNGLKLHSYKLANGYRVSIIPMEGSPATVKNYVNVGSLNETEDIKGISHFLEHMAFNGTIGNEGYMKLNSGDSFNKIEKLGGWTNASTGYAVTDYVNSTPLLEEKDLEEQIKIIASMTENLALTPQMIEKEKGPVCSEINMIMDDPMTIANDQMVRTLFNIKSSADELIGGSTHHIKNLTREKVKDYYDKYYTPDNMNLVITGDVNPDKVIEIVSKNFHSQKVSKGNKFEEKLTPIQSTVRKDFISDKTNSTHMTVGFVGPQSNDTKSAIIMDILSTYTSQTDVGLDKELKNINADFMLNADKVSNNPKNPMVLYYSLKSSEQNSEKALKIVFDKLSNLKAPSEDKLQNIKDFMLQAHKDNCEYSGYINNVVGNRIITGNLDYITNYENILKSITTKDIQDFIDKYIDLNKAAVTVVHPKTNIEALNKNHIEASQLSFKGKRRPINTEKINQIVLENNIRTTFLEGNNENIYFTINYNYPPIVDKKANPAARLVLNKILSMGTMYQTEDEFNKYIEDNNIDVVSTLSQKQLNVLGYSNNNNFEKTFEKAKELLYNPRITEDTVQKAVEQIKDSINRSEDTATSIYNEYKAKDNPLYHSKDEILKCLDNITVEDVKKLHKYILDNANAEIIMNTSQNNNIKETAINNFKTLENVKPSYFYTPRVYKPNNETVVLTKEKNVSQAEIMETFKYEFNNTPREQALGTIMNILLSNSSIGLFTVLREKEHLAYKVSSNNTHIGNCGELSCKIKTTTDNKANGEISYDNVQKSINGFNRQIKALLNSEYTDQDLENAKRMLKANLLNKESTLEKLIAIEKGCNHKEGYDLNNKIYDEIDNITKEDIQEFAQKVFNDPPVYTVVASKDTLEANKDFFETL